MTKIKNKGMLLIGMWFLIYCIVWILMLSL